MTLPNVSDMSRAELEAEVLRLRGAIVLWASKHGDARCWEADVELALAAGVWLEYPEPEGSARKFLKNCRRYALRQCEARRLKNDLPARERTPDERPMRMWLISVDGFPDFYQAATTRDKARHAARRAAKEAFGFDLAYGDIRVVRAPEKEVLG